MAQRPTFDMSKLTTADKILLGAGILLFVDSFFAWQRACATFLGTKICGGSWSAWSGSGSFAGILMGLLVIAMIIWMGLQLAGVNLQLGVPGATIGAGLVLGTVVFGLIKFLFVVANHASIGAWLGIILLLVLAYGGYMKMQEPKTAGSAPPAMGGPPPPPA